MVENEFKRKGKAIRTDGPQMTRSEALRTMGAYAAGMTFFGGSPGNPDLSESGEEMVSGKIPDDPVLAKAIAEAGDVKPNIVADGISQALITTVQDK